LDDTDTLRNELALFRNATFSPPPPTPHPPLILEVSLVTQGLLPQQSLVLVSSQSGQRHIVEGPLNRWLRGSEIVLERWCVDLVTPPKLGAPDLPVVYKKAVVLFRRVFTEARLLPTWRLKKRLAKVKLTNSLELKVRVVNGETTSPNRERIPLSMSLIDGLQKDKLMDDFSFGQIDTPAGFPLRMTMLIVEHFTFPLHIDLKQTFE
jgi:autophagy-related protein 13